MAGAGRILKNALAVAASAACLSRSRRSRVTDQDSTATDLSLIHIWCTFRRWWRAACGAARAVPAAPAIPGYGADPCRRRPGRVLVGGGGAWLRCPWAGAGPGRALSRRAERSSQRGRLAGGPPPTGTPSSPAPQPGPPPPEHRRRNTPPRHSKAARPHRGRAAHPVSEDHRRITTISGLPRPLSWRTFEMPSFEAMSLAVPSIRGSS